MKGKLKDLLKDNATKLIAATIIPGGFIALAAYELGKYIEKNKKDDEKSRQNNKES